MKNIAARKTAPGFVTSTRALNLIQENRLIVLKKLGKKDITVDIKPDSVTFYEKSGFGKRQSMMGTDFMTKEDAANELDRYLKKGYRIDYTESIEGKIGSLKEVKGFPGAEDYTPSKRYYEKEYDLLEKYDFMNLKKPGEQDISMYRTDPGYDGWTIDNGTQEEPESSTLHDAAFYLHKYLKQGYRVAESRERKPYTRTRDEREFGITSCIKCQRPTSVKCAHCDIPYCSKACQAKDH